MRLLRVSQVAWIVGLAASVCTALVGQAELLGEPWRHIVTGLGVFATAATGFMLKHPWDAGQVTYIVVQGGVGAAVSQAAFEAHLKEAAGGLPQPLPVIAQTLEA